MNSDSSESYLGNHLLSMGKITEDDLRKAMSVRQQIDSDLGSILVRIGAISENNLLRVLSELFDIQIAGNDQLPVDPMVFLSTIEKSSIDKEWWLDQELLVWENADGLILSVSREPLNDSIDEILEKTFPDNKRQSFLVRSYDMERLLESVSRVMTSSKTGMSDVEQLRELAEEAPVVEFVNNVFAQALEQDASDVHIEPGENTFEIRFRCDGILRSRFKISMDRFPAISSRVKLVSGMDISERRLPQDGRLSLRLSGVDVDIRASAVPGVHGESIVLRLLPKEGGGFDFVNLGLFEKERKMLEAWINKPHGIFLVTGPTGSGKSTTLYSALEFVNQRSKKIITVEDPVEYHIQGITQIQTHSEIGYTFASALRSFLRQDPDIIMVGEIRDKETAEIAIQASLTGHLVLSTLHTNDAVSAFTRLIDMGIDPFLIATPIRGVMAQRLVRKLCPECAEPDSPIADIVELARRVLPQSMKDIKPDWRKPKGCSRCHGTGYTGREGIFELVDVTPEVQHLILNNGTNSQIREISSQQGLRTMREDGLLKAWRGITCIEEVLRVSSE